MVPKDAKSSSTMVHEDAEQNPDESDEEEEEDVLVDMPQYLLDRVEKLKDLDRKRDEKMAEYMTERAALEAKYQSMYSKLYDERKAIIQGDKDEADDEASPKQVKGVPQFWVCAIAHMETIQALLSEDDVCCLEFLKDVTCEDDADGKGFTLSFFFEPNPYFENSVLTKRYDVPNLLIGDEPILKNVVGSEITWKEGKSLTHKTVIKKQRGKGKQAGQIRNVAKEERIESFFHWFEPLKMPSLEDTSALENMTEEDAANLEAMFEMDYEIAQALRTRIIPKAVLWFTGHAAQPDLEEAVDELLGESS